MVSQHRPHRFIVWSYDPYVDRDGDRLPELPISRIPDALDPLLLVGALTRSRARPVQVGPSSPSKAETIKRARCRVHAAGSTA